MRSERLLLIALATLNFSHIVDFMIIMPLGPQLMRTFDIDTGQFSLLVSAYLFSAASVGFFATFFIDRFGRKKLLLTAYSMFLLGTLLCGLAPNHHWLLFARVFTGAFGGLLSTLVMSIVGDIIPLERRGAAMGIIMTAFSMAATVGVPFSVYLANHFSWHAPFFLVVAMGLVVLLLIIKVLPPLTDHITDPPPKADPIGVLKRVFGDFNQRRALTLSFVQNFGHFCVIPLLSPYMVRNVGLREDDLPLIYLIGGGLTFFSAPVFGKLSDKYGKILIYSICAPLCIIPIVWMTNMPPTSLYLALVCTALFFVLSNGRFVPGQTILTAVVPGKERGSFMSINSCVQQIALGLGSYTGGMIAVTAVSGEVLRYPVVGAISAAAALGTVFLVRRIQLRA